RTGPVAGGGTGQVSPPVGRGRGAAGANWAGLESYSAGTEMAPSDGSPEPSDVRNLRAGGIRSSHPGVPLPSRPPQNPLNVPPCRTGPPGCDGRCPVTKVQVAGGGSWPVGLFPPTLSRYTRSPRELPLGLGWGALRLLMSPERKESFMSWRPACLVVTALLIVEG